MYTSGLTAGVIFATGITADGVFAKSVTANFLTTVGAAVTSLVVSGSLTAGSISSTGSITAGSFVSSATVPTADQHLANKAYVDSGTRLGSSASFILNCGGMASAGAFGLLAGWQNNTGTTAAKFTPPAGSGTWSGYARSDEDTYAWGVTAYAGTLYTSPLQFTGWAQFYLTRTV